MSVIAFNGPIVQSLSLGLKQNIIKIDNNQRQLSSTKNNVDYRISSRRNIGSRLNNAAIKIDSIESKLKAMDTFINASIGKYSDSETTAAKKAEEIKSFQDVAIVKAIKSVVDNLTSFGNKMDPNKLLYAGKGLRFEAINKNGNVYLKIVGGKILTKADYLKYRDLMKEHLGDSQIWRKKFLQRLVNDGVPLYRNSGPSKGYIANNQAKLTGTKFNALDDYLSTLDQTKRSKMLSTFKQEIKLNTDYKGWKDATKLTKVTKGLGIAGTAITAGMNIFDPKLNAVQKVTHTAVDVISGTAAMATGAAIGSLIVPPLGTIVGAGVGLAVNFAMNYKIPLFGNKSIVDLTKEGVDYVADAIVDKAKDVYDAVSDGFNNIGNKLSKIFW
ncbi:hypothetical protein [Paenibacillus sp. L3-i20]|uniref:hypothetical protein n=1 Tax=Paenibacillus sp. L3-i20 TaxID=2905833 RepID=UPI001EDE3AAF|nr:hypothetical protein [Paenibacillus sp. L3-i20]GKU77588.1 hypothetical protein L3i20_v219850 [Paenibacillus sp. L3-i20]